MDDVLFTELLEWFSEFLPQTEQHILLVDGHDSHERYSVLQMARKNRIIIIRFPANKELNYQNPEATEMTTSSQTYRARKRDLIRDAGRQKQKEKDYRSWQTDLELFLNLIKRSYLIPEAIL